jgi:hypothetical protein
MNLISVDAIPYAWARKELTFAGPCRKGDKGPKAVLAQEWLTLHGYGLKIDGDFGAASALAVRQFQTAQGLPVTGEVDAATFAALTTPMLRALTPLPAVGTFHDLVVSYARQHLAEHPLEVGKANCGPWVRLYMTGKQGAEWYWCAGFVCFILKQAADTLKKAMPFPSTFSCDTLAAVAKERGLFVAEKAMAQRNPGKRDMTPGSIFLDRRTPTDWTHTGLVTAFHGDAFETIEGNTNDDGSRDGYEVCKRVRGYVKRDFIKIS